MKSALSKGGLILIIISLASISELEPNVIQSLCFILGSVAFMVGD